MSERTEADFPVTTATMETNEEMPTPTQTSAPGQMSTDTVATTRSAETPLGKSEKSPAKPAPRAAKSGGASSKAAYETVVIQTGIEAKDFLQVIQPILPKGESIRAVGLRAAVVTATSETVETVQKIAAQLVQSLDPATSGVVARGALLSDATEESSRTYSREHVYDILKNYGVAPTDAVNLAIPEEMAKLCDFAFPVSGNGETRLSLTDQMDLHLQTELHAPDIFSAKATLTQKDKGVNPFDTGSPGRVLLMNDFDVAVGKAVVLGVTRPGRSLMLLIQFAGAGEPAPSDPVQMKP